MMKLSHLLKSRAAVSEKLLPAFTSQAGMSFARPDSHDKSPYAGKRSGSVFADYTVYKGKAALNMSPIMPKFTKLDSGGLKVEKKGVVILSFSPAIGERKYDWEKKQAFALSATEVGSLISLGPGKSCEFFHDPSMKSSNAGQIRKSLSVTPLSPEDTGYFFTLSVVNGIQKTNERFSVPITKAEFAVMRTACSYILPHIMGWDQYANQPPPRSTGVNPVRQSEMRVTLDDEWDR